MSDRYRVKVPIAGVVYPSPELLEHYHTQGPLRMETLAAALTRSFETHAARTILDSSEGVLTYAQFDELSDRLAAGLLDLGLKPLERVLFQLPNGRDLLLSVVACIKAGLIPVCTLASHRELEIGQLARHSAARAHIVGGSDLRFDYIAFAERMRAEAPSLELLIAAGNAPSRPGVISLEELITRTRAANARRRIRTLIDSFDPFQVVMFQLSGGTTGVPKIIPRFNDEYLYQIRSIAHFLSVTADDVLPCQVPMLHNAPIIVCWGPAFLQGATVLTDVDLSPPGIVAMLRRRPATCILLPPPLIASYLAAFEQLPDARRHVRIAVSIRSIEEIRRAIGAPTVPLFGMTEGIVMLGKPEDPIDALTTTAGRPVCDLDEIRLLEPGTERPVPLGQTGELAFRGPSSLRGYFDAEERNREVFTSDGLYRSGDLMTAREIGGHIFYTFEGRIKDVIDRGGEKINCEEVERHLRTYPGVRDAALIPVPDPKYGERGCACLVLIDSLSAPTIAQLGEHLRVQGLAKFKWPERIEQLEALPFNRTAKTDKAALRKLITARMAATV